MLLLLVRNRSARRRYFEILSTRCAKKSRYAEIRKTSGISGTVNATNRTTLLRMSLASSYRKMSASPSHFSASASLVCSSWLSLLLIISTIEVNAFPVLLSSNHQRRRTPKAYLSESRFATAHLLPRHQSSSTAQGAGPNPFVNDEEYAAGGLSSFESEWRRRYVLSV